ncbi:MAG: hypothetical protein FWG36_08575 [Oscillospiraceae bacterium]|nr:hypothetical protein [Oscillospiraceae bacterium]
MRFFLGTNGPNGFFSYFDQLIDYSNAKDVTIIKGGPGCGKSTYMNIIDEALKMSDAEYIYCSADPKSLDAIVYPEAGIAMVDGTAPHIFEPSYPGAVDSYVNLGNYIKRDELFKLRGEIERIMTDAKTRFCAAARWVKAARHIDESIYERVADSNILSRITKRARALCGAEIPMQKAQPVQIVKRFLSSMTPDGLITFFDTVSENFGRVIALDDNYGLSSNYLKFIVKHSVNSGYKTYVCYSPLHPESGIEHVLIPELDLAIVTNSRARLYSGEPTRHIRLDALVPKEKLRGSRAYLRFLAQTRTAFIDEAAEQLSLARECHGKLEKLYNPYIDFEAVKAMAKAKAENLKSVVKYI